MGEGSDLVWDLALAEDVLQTNAAVLPLGCDLGKRGRAGERRLVGDMSTIAFSSLGLAVVTVIRVVSLCTETVQAELKVINFNVLVEHAESSVDHQGCEDLTSQLLESTAEFLDGFTKRVARGIEDADGTVVNDSPISR